MEIHVPGGIVCIHAHIYTDTVKASERIQEECMGYLRELSNRLRDDGARVHYGPIDRPPVLAFKRTEEENT